VAINAQLLGVTREALALSAAQADLNRENLRLLRSQANAQATERVGPVLATIRTIVDHLTTWQTYAADLRANASLISDADISPLADEARQIVKITSALSLKAYRHLLLALPLLIRLDREISELRTLTSTSHLTSMPDPATATSIGQQIVPLIEDVSRHLEAAENELRMLLP